MSVLDALVLVMAVVGVCAFIGWAALSVVHAIWPNLDWPVRTGRDG
jgi:hypothetical protein